MQQQHLDRLVLNSLQGLYSEDTTNSFVDMAEKGDPAEAIAGTALMLIGSQSNAAKQAGVDIDPRLIPAAANEISKHLGQMLLVAGVLDKSNAKEVMQQAAALFKEQMGGQAPAEEAPQGGLVQQAQPGV